MRELPLTIKRARMPDAHSLSCTTIRRTVPPGLEFALARGPQRRECTDMTHLFDISRVPLCCSHWLASICRPLQNLLNPLVESIRIESELRQLRLECLRCSWRRNERQREQ